jgi:hypothetical protein
MWCHLSKLAPLRCLANWRNLLCSSLTLLGETLSTRCISHHLSWHLIKFACLGMVTDTQYIAAVLPVVNIPGDEKQDVQVIWCTGTQPSCMFHCEQNDYVFHYPNHYVEGNLVLTWRRILVWLNCLFFAQESIFGVVTPLALITTSIPGMICHSSGCWRYKNNLRRMILYHEGLTGELDHVTLYLLDR